MKSKKTIIVYVIFCFITLILFTIKFGSNKGENSDIFIQGFLLLIILLTIGILSFKKNISNKTKIGLILVAIVLFISYPLYNDYLVYSHDIAFGLMKIDGLKSALESFQIPARIYPLVNNGYGYAVPMLYPELFIYIPAILRVLNVSIEFSYKILIFFINAAAVFSMYMAVKKISKSTAAGIIGSIIYATATYRLVDTYTRGAIGEALAMSFFPLVIWGLYELCVGDKKKWYIFVIGITCIIQSHILSLITTAMVCIVIFVYFIKNIIKEKRYFRIILSGILIVLVNLWFIVPFLEAYSLDLNVKARPTSVNSYMFDFHNVIPAELFNVFDDICSNRTSKSNDIGMPGEMNLSLGLFCTIGIPLCIIYLFKNRNENNNLNKFIKILVFLGITFLLLSTSIIPWETLQEMYKPIRWLSATMQFAWRFLGPATVTIAMAMSIIIGKYVDSKYKENTSIIENYKIVFEIGITAIAIFVIIASPYSKQEKYKIVNYNPVPYPEYYLLGTNISLLSEDKYVTSNRSIQITNHQKEGSKIVLDYINYINTGYIEVPLLYYPGYVAKDENGKKLEITCGDNNVVRIELNERKAGTITVDYEEKPIYRLADIVSLVSILGLLIYIIINKKSKKVLH